VADRYDHDRGHGWGAVAMSYGIKPGSPQFFALKNGVAGSYGRWGHPIGVGRDEHVRWGEIKAHKSEHGHGNGHWHGDDEHGHDHGRGGHGRGNDMDGGHDQRDDKGHGHDNDHGHGHH